MAHQQRRALVESRPSRPRRHDRGAHAPGQQQVRAAPRARAGARRAPCPASSRPAASRSADAAAQLERARRAAATTCTPSARARSASGPSGQASTNPPGSPRVKSSRVRSAPPSRPAYVTASVSTSGETRACDVLGTAASRLQHGRPAGRQGRGPGARRRLDRGAHALPRPGRLRQVHARADVHAAVRRAGRRRACSRPSCARSARTRSAPRSWSATRSCCGWCCRSW